jgi:hypothetical protein
MNATQLTGVRLLAILLGGGGGFLGIVAGSWILPLTVALAQKGWSGMHDVPVTEHCFGGVPTWILPTSQLHDFVVVGGALLGLVGAGIGAIRGMRWWRFLVVKKFAWMTSEQADAFERSGPDG